MQCEYEDEGEAKCEGEVECGVRRVDLHTSTKKIPSSRTGFLIKYLILLRLSDPIWLLSLCLTHLRILQCTSSVRRDLPCCREYTPLSLWSFYHSLPLQHILSLMSGRS